MVQIKIKAINQKYEVHCSFDDETTFYNELEKKLSACSKKARFFEAFFHFYQPLTEEQIRQTLAIANQNHTLVLGFNYTPSKQVIHRIETSLFSGQSYRFEEPILILGSIANGAFVQSSESIYCIGQVSGNIDLLHEDCELHASAFFQANIRICDSEYQNVTNFSPSYIYYENTTIIVKQSKEERVWGVQSQSLQEKVG